VEAELANTVDRIGSVATALCDADELLVRLIVVDQLTIDEALALRSCDVDCVQTDSRTAALARRLRDPDNPHAPLCGRTLNAAERFLACRLVDGTIRAAGVKYDGRHQLRSAQLRASF
jgi:hypothetical protein